MAYTYVQYKTKAVSVNRRPRPGAGARQLGGKVTSTMPLVATAVPTMPEKVPTNRPPAAIDVGIIVKVPMHPAAVAGAAIGLKFTL